MLKSNLEKIAASKVSPDSLPGICHILKCAKNSSEDISQFIYSSLIKCENKLYSLLIKTEKKELMDDFGKCIKCFIY